MCTGVALANYSEATCEEEAEREEERLSQVYLCACEEAVSSV